MTDINIPSEALEAAATEIAPHAWSMYTEAARDHFRDKARAVCLAMLKNWPGMWEQHITSPTLNRPLSIILPLPTENTNADG